MYVGTSHESPSSVAVAPRAMKHRLLVKYAGLMRHQGAYYLEDGPRRVLRLSGPDKHGFIRIVRKFHVVVAALASDHQIGVVARAAYEAEDFAGSGFVFFFKQKTAYEIFT